MSAKRKSFQVTRDNKHVTVYPWTHPKTGSARWRYSWRVDEDSPWRYVTCKTKEDAKEDAWIRLGRLSSKGLVWDSLSQDEKRYLEDVHRLSKSSDYQPVLSFLKARQKSADITLSVQRFLAHKIQGAGEETRHLDNVRRDLEAMAKNFNGLSVLDISDEMLRAWWDTRAEGKSDKTRNGLRANMVSFWSWCIWDGIFPKEVTPADKLPRVAKLPIGKRRVLTPDEFLALAREIKEEWRPWIVLGAFCGLRPEEIAPPQKKGASKKSKRGIRGEEIDFQFKVIRLPEEVSKVDAPRNVPLCEAALAWLEWAGINSKSIGAVCLRNPSEKDETARLGKLVFKTGWPQDALRHSYGSYRNAMIRNLPQVAEEMGTSETMLRRHYHNPRTMEEGAAWFELRPEMIRCVPMKTEQTAIPAKTKAS